MFEHMANRIGLHECIEITYAVYAPQFAAALSAKDGTQIVAVGEGDTIVEALTDLENKLIGKAVDAPKVANKPAADWRIGLTVKPKMRTHELHYEQGEVVAILPDGTNGLFDPTGILKIRMQTGRVIVARADEWVTA